GLARGGGAGVAACAGGCASVCCGRPRAPAAAPPRLEETPERLEVPQPIVAELGHQRPRVEVQPGRLDVHRHAELGAFLYRFLAHEVRMRDARPRLAEWDRLADLLVRVDQRVDGAVAHGVSGEL